LLPTPGCRCRTLPTHCSSCAAPTAPAALHTRFTTAYYAHAHSQHHGSILIHLHIKNRLHALHAARTAASIFETCVGERAKRQDARHLSSLSCLPCIIVKLRAYTYLARRTYNTRAHARAASLEGTTRWFRHCRTRATRFAFLLPWNRHLRHTRAPAPHLCPTSPRRRLTRLLRILYHPPARFSAYAYIGLPIRAFAPPMYHPIPADRRTGCAQPLAAIPFHLAVLPCYHSTHRRIPPHTHTSLFPCCTCPHTMPTGAERTVVPLQHLLPHPHHAHPTPLRTTPPACYGKNTLRGRGPRHGVRSRF